MRFRGLDLNLLLALDNLLALRNVSAAARRLHVSQPAMSGSLARLREHFEDALLVAVGKRMELTALGESLMPAVRDVLDKVESTVTMRPTFDPAVAKRRFSLAASEYTVSTLLVEVLRRVKKQSSAITVDLLPADAGQMNERLNSRDLDFAFSVGHFIDPSHPHFVVIEDTFHCVAWKGNRRLGKSLPLEKYLVLGHAATRYGFDRRPGFEEYALQQLGIERHVEVTCTTPMLLGPLVVGTDRIATLPTRLALHQCATLPLKMFTPPIALPPLRISMHWHRSRELDSASIWLRGLIAETARELGQLPV